MWCVWVCVFPMRHSTGLLNPECCLKVLHFIYSRILVHLLVCLAVCVGAETVDFSGPHPSYKLRTWDLVCKTNVGSSESCWVDQPKYLVRERDAVWDCRGKKRINIYENKHGDKNRSKASERGNAEEVSHFIKMSARNWPLTHVVNHGIWPQWNVSH